MNKSYDSLVDLFESIENFLRRLKIYIEIPPTQAPAVTEIVVKIMATLITVLALATEQMKQGRLSMFTFANDSLPLTLWQRNTQKNFWERRRLNQCSIDSTDSPTRSPRWLSRRLTKLSAVWSVRCRWYWKVRILSMYKNIHGTKDQSGRWQGLDRRYATEPRYVHLTGVIKYHLLTWSSSPHAGDSSSSEQDWTFVITQYHQFWAQRLKLLCRWQITRELLPLVVCRRSVGKSKYCPQSASSRYGHVVYRRRHLQKMEIGEFPYVDPWLTFAYLLPIFYQCWFSPIWLAGSGKSVLW